MHNDGFGGADISYIFKEPVAFCAIHFFDF